MEMEKESLLFKVLGDPTRLRLAALLATRDEICVCLLAEALRVPDFKVSRHLAVLRGAGMVASRREGTWIHYHLSEPQSELEHRLRDCLRDCLKTHQVVRDDLDRLSRLACTPAKG